MSYYSFCKVDLTDFACYDKNKTVEQNLNIVHGKILDFKAAIDEKWSKLAILCASSGDNDARCEELISDLKTLYTKYEKACTLSFLLNEDVEEEDHLGEHERTYWVNHYGNASCIHSKWELQESIALNEKYINEYFTKVRLMAAMDPVTLMHTDEERFNSPMDAVMHYIDLYREAVEEFFCDRDIDMLFSKYPSKNEEEEDWQS